MSGGKSVILVTGGSGLVGQAIKKVVNDDRRQGTEDSKNEIWIFSGSKEGDLRYADLFYDCILRMYIRSTMNKEKPIECTREWLT